MGASADGSLFGFRAGGFHLTQREELDHRLQLVQASIDLDDACPHGVGRGDVPHETGEEAFAVRLDDEVRVLGSPSTVLEPAPVDTEVEDGPAEAELIGRAYPCERTRVGTIQEARSRTTRA
jgi:hypothetical protein